MSNDKKTDKIDNNFVESIKNYGNDLVEIESFIEGVRTLPGFYIGAIGNVGWLACIREIFQNAIDEMMRRVSPCHYIKVSFDERSQRAVIEDTGRGIPHGKIIKIFTTERMSSNYNKKENDDPTAGAHGVGSGVALALSKYFEVNSYVLGVAKQVKFDAGKPWDKGEYDIPCPEGRQGSTIIMEPDPKILGVVNLTCTEVFDMVFKIFTLINIGDRIDFTGVDSNGKVTIYEELINKDGIITDLIMKTQSPIIAPITFASNNGITKAEIAFTYDSSDLTVAEDITSFANFTPTTGGTHVDGFMDGLCIYFRNYMNKIYLGEKAKVTVVNSDIKTGLKAVVNASHINPVFKGQFKGILSNEDMVPFIKNLTISSLEGWAKTHPGDLQKICKMIKEIAEIRTKSDDNKIKLSTKYETSLITGKPKGYIQPSGNKELELVIVEGKSALGSTKNSRDYTRQGIYPIRGKLPNAFTTSKAKFLNNEEVATIITLVGGGYGKSFDISKVKWDKIILLADADSDGSHIDCLLLRFFLLYMPEIITSGKLYRAVPPLYGIRNSRGNKYFASKLDFTRYIQTLFANQYSFTTMDGRKFSNAEASAFFMKNMDYSYDLEVLSNIFAIDPYLLEIVLFYLADHIDMGSMKNVVYMAKKVAEDKKKKKEEPKKTPAKKVKDDSEEVLSKEDSIDESLLPVKTGSVAYDMSYSLKPTFSLKQLKSIVKKNFRFVDVKEQNGCPLIEGLVNSKYQYIFINDNFIKNCLKIIAIIKTNASMYYKLNNETASLYTLMKTFESMTPNGLTRYKGLGEQDPKQLGESVLRPDSDRVLIRYTIDSVKEEIEAMRHIDSSMALLINQAKITRQDIE